MKLVIKFFTLLTISLSALAANERANADSKEGEVVQVQFNLSSELNRRLEDLKIKCDDLILFALSSPGGRILPKCRVMDYQKSVQFLENPTSVVDQNDYHFFVWEDFGGDFHIHARNRVRADDTEFQKAEWRIQATKELFGNVKKLIHNVVSYERSKESLKRFFVELGAKDSKTINYVNGQFVRFPGNTKLTWQQAYTAFLGEGKKNKNYLRTAIELAVALGVGVNWYYRNHDLNSVDFDYANYRDSFRTRFTSFDAVRFDSNDAGINTMHIFPAGVAYYLIARSNGLSQMESFLASFVTSSLWEYFIEFREVVSINDAVMTPVGGAILGETIHQLGRLFKKGGFKNKAISTVMNPVEAFNYWLDEVGSGKGPRLDTDSGFDPSIFSRFEVFISKNFGKASEDNLYFDNTFWGVDAEIVNVPVAPGRSEKFLLDGSGMTSLLAKMTTDENAIADLRLVAKTSLLFAYQARNLNYNKQGQLNGYTFVVGPTQGLDIDFQKLLNSEAYKDMIMNVQILGNSMDITRYYGDYRLRMAVDLFPNFAMVRSYAFDKYRNDHDITNVQSTLVKDNTYYAYGYSTGLKLGAGFSKIDLMATYRSDKFFGLNKRTRFMEVETTYLDLGDQRETQDYSAKVNITNKSLFKCGFEIEKRSGYVQNFSAESRREKTKYCAISYSFL